MLSRLFKTKSNPSDLVTNHGKISYSQTGEDIIIEHIFGQLRITNPSYLDLGAHHPQMLSNTYFFYKKGSRGVNVEPDPFLIEDFNKLRPHDVNLNVGIGFDDNKHTADFFIMSARVLNTFSEEEALRVQGYGTYKIDKTISVPLMSVGQVLNKYFNSSKLNFVSIDVEGLDFEIIQTFDFDTWRPEVFCIETITYTEDKSESKLTNIINFMITKNYFVYADTYINTIFVDTNSWKQRVV